MKIINIDINDNIILNSIEDLSTGTIKSLNSKLKFPTGNYQNILLNFNFISPIPEEDLKLIATFLIGNNSVDVTITSIKVNNKTYRYACYIPPEVFEEPCDVALGLYGFKLDDNENLVKRMSLIPIDNEVVKGSYNPDSKESVVPSPTVFEVYFNKIDNAYDEFKTEIEELFDEANQNLKKIKHFNSIAEMKADATILDTYMVVTLGYYKKNDGGGATYLIRTKTSNDVEDDGTIHFISNNLVAELVIKNNTLTPEEFGIINLEDATEKLQKLIDYCIANDYILRMSNKTYNITNLYLKTVTMFCEGTNFQLLENATTGLTITSTSKKYIEFSNFNVLGNDTATAITVVHCKNLRLNKIKIQNVKLGIDYQSGYELYIDSVNMENFKDIENSVGLKVSSDDSCFDNIVIVNFYTCVQALSGGGNYYNKIHGWNTNSNVAKNSTFFEVSARLNITDSVSDTCLIGFKILKKVNVNCKNVRSFINTQFMNPGILGELVPYIFYFEDPSYSSNIRCYEMYASKSPVFPVLYFSNLTPEEFCSPFNIIANNRITDHSNMPYGRIYNFDGSGIETFTIDKNEIIANEEKTSINFKGVYNGETSNEVILGVLPEIFRPKEEIISYFTYSKSLWDAPEGLGYIYIGTGGTVSIKVTSEMITNNYFNINLSFLRKRTNY